MSGSISVIDLVGSTVSHTDADSCRSIGLSSESFIVCSKL